MRLTILFLSFLFSGLVSAQTYVVRDIKSFGAKGDGKTNDQEAFQKAAAFFNARGGGGKLVIPKGIYLVGRQVFNRNMKTKPVYEGSDVLALVNVKNMVIEGEKGTVIKFTKGLRFGAFQPQTGEPLLHGNTFFADGYSMAVPGNAIVINNGSNVTIRLLELDGSNATLITGGVYGDTGIQLPHSGVYIVNSTAITLDNLHSHNFGLDGIMIGNNTGDSLRPDKILLTNCTFDSNGRQGFSWIGGNDLKAVGCHFNFNGTGKISSAPKAGVDIEAERGTIRNGVFISCEFVANAGCGLVAESGPSSNCTFTDCTFWGATNWALWIDRPGYKVMNSKIYGSFVHGYDAATDAEATVFEACLFEDKPFRGQEPFGKFLIESNGKRRMRFDNCTMIAHKKKIAWMESDANLKPEEKYQLNNCKLVFEGGIFPEGGWVAITRSVRYKNCTFELTQPEAKSFYFGGIRDNYNVDLGGNKFIVNKAALKNQ